MAVPDLPACLTLTLPDHWAASDRALEAIEYPNPAWTFQRGHFGTLALTPLPGVRTSTVSMEATMQLRAWQEEREASAGEPSEAGALHGFNAGFAPFDAEGRNPGLAAAMAWSSPEQARASGGEYDAEHPFPAFAPAFVLEIRSPYQSLRDCREKMRIWLHFGAQLGWLIDPDHLDVWLFRAGRSPQRLSKPSTLKGEQVLRGLRFDCRPIWSALLEGGEPPRSSEPLVDWRKSAALRGAIDPSYRPGGSDPALRTVRSEPLPLLDLWMPDEWPLDDAALAQLRERNPDWAFDPGPDGGLQINDPNEAESGGALNEEALINPEAPGAPTVMSAAASWVSDERLKEAERSNASGTIEAVPNFVAEIRSGSQPLAALQNKMLRWIYHGVQLGWLLDPDMRTVWIYREGRPPEQAVNPRQLSGEDVMKGFTLELDQIWDWAGNLEEGGDGG